MLKTETVECGGGGCRDVESQIECSIVPLVYSMVESNFYCDSSFYQ